MWKKSLMRKIESNVEEGVLYGKREFEPKGLKRQSYAQEGVLCGKCEFLSKSIEDNKMDEQVN